MCKDGISLPGFTLKYLFSYLLLQTYFSLCDKANSDLYNLIKDNNTGGPSIIHFIEAGKTKIREAEKGPAAKLCEKIVGYDTNALYLWAMTVRLTAEKNLTRNEISPWLRSEKKPEPTLSTLRVNATVSWRGGNINGVI